MVQAENRILPLKLERSLLLVPIRKPTDWELDNLPRIHLTNEEPLDPATLNDDTKGKVIFPEDGDTKDDMFDYLRNINFADMDMDAPTSDTEVDTMLNWMHDQRYDHRHISPTYSKTDLKDPSKYIPNLGFVNEQELKYYK